MHITSRFWSAIRKRDWGTAAIDVAVVAVGILMALAVDEWRAEREAGRQAWETLQRMHSETVQAISDYTTRQERRFENLDNLYNVRRLVLNVPPDDALSEPGCLGLVYSRRLVFADTRIPVVEELSATGALSVIQDPELRNAALAFINTRDRELAWATLWSSQMHDLPFLFPDLISIGLKVADDPEDRDGFGLAPVCDLAAMRKDGKFQNALVSNVANIIDTVEGMEGYLWPKIKHLHELLDVRLGIAHP